MLSKTQIKYIKSLQLHKYRKEYRYFVAEGEKIALEWLKSSQPIHQVIATENWINHHQTLLQSHPSVEIIMAAKHDLERISSHKNAPEVLLLIPFPEEPENPLDNTWTLALDNIQDPGNMGTIIRIADWFGIRQIILSKDSVDIYNPKVLQAAMGSHTRVAIFEKDLLMYFKNTPQDVYATVLNGQSIYEVNIEKPGILLIGNEGKGIQPALILPHFKQVTIPSKGNAESLNAAVATGIICAQFLR